MSPNEASGVTAVVEDLLAGLPATLDALPSASSPGGWEVVEKMGWEVFSTEASAEAAAAPGDELEAGSAQGQRPT